MRQLSLNRNSKPVREYYATLQQYDASAHALTFGAWPRMLSRTTASLQPIQITASPSTFTMKTAPTAARTSPTGQWSGIVELLGRIITVSIETVRLVESLSALHSPL